MTTRATFVKHFFDVWNKYDKHMHNKKMLKIQQTTITALISNRYRKQTIQYNNLVNINLGNWGYST